jgi:lipopolysaccharide biosynthesis regulator YciM
MDWESLTNEARDRLIELIQADGELNKALEAAAELATGQRFDEEEYACVREKESALTAAVGKVIVQVAKGL